MATAVPIVVQAPSAQWGADNYTVEDGLPAVQLAAADPQRRSVTVYTDPNSLGILYLTPSGGVGAGGIRLVPGAGYELFTGGAIYGRAIGGDVLVSVASETGWSC